jgi:maltoporin
VGWGLEGVKTPIGRFSYAWLDIGDFAGYGISPALGGFNPDLIGGGSRTTNVHDFRLENIPVNPNGWLTLGFDYARADNRDGTSTYTRDVTQTIYVDDDNDPTTPNVPIDVVVKKEFTIDNKPGKDGYGLHFEHKQDDLFGLGGFNQVVLKYAKDAMTIKGVGIAGSTQPRREWLLFDQWVIEPKGSPFTAFVTAGYRSEDVQVTSGPAAGQWVKGDEFWIGARPQYHLNDVWSLMSEIGYQQAKSEGDNLGDRKLAKLTLGTQFSMGRNIWSRPSIRFFGTWAKWNDAAAQAGKNTGYGVTCTGRDCTTRIDAYDDKRNGFSYGVQVEGWF